MTKRVKHSGQLIHQSLRLVIKQKKLIVLPFLSSITMLIILALVVTPFVNYEKAQLALQKNETHLIAWAYVILLLLLFVIHQIALYFSAALTYCVNVHIHGKSVQLIKGIKNANSHFIQLYNWNSFAGTIGIFLMLFQKWLRNFSFHKKMFKGLSWFIATYLVIPVIMSEKTGPIKSIKRSAELIHATWGENLKTNFGIIPLLVFARFLTMVPLIIGFIKGTHQDIIIGTVLTIALVIIVTTISSITHTVLACVLYLYTSKNKIVPEFNEKLIKNAFIKTTV